MLKKILIGGIVVVLVLGIGLFIWARSVLATDAVRSTLATQLAKALGQPVTVGTVSASIYPRVTVNLGDVSIGEPARIKVGRLHVGTDFRALLSRRIEHASLNLTGARIELPLPRFAATRPAEGADAPQGLPVEIVSIDEIVLRDVEIVSGGRTLRGDVEVVPQDRGFVIRKATLGADTAKIEITGRITDRAGPVGELALVAGALDFNALQQFASDFSGGTGLGASQPENASSPSGAGPSAMNLAISLQAERASLGSLRIDTLAGTARVSGGAITLEPVGFNVFGGKYEGTLVLSLAATPEFRLNATLAGLDMAAATAFAGNPNTITGRLAGRIELSGRGMDGPGVLKTTRGSARIDITDGTVRNLGLVQTLVVATSGRADAKSPSDGSRDEPFSHLGGTLNISGGFASMPDLRFESKDLLLAAGGAMRLDGSVINLQGQMQLSDELSQQAGRDLLRYTQDQGRVTVPATITGSASNLQVRIDVASMAKRAVTNRAKEEAQKAIKKGLGDLFRR
jgi:hypothetical protein